MINLACQLLIIFGLLLFNVLGSTFFEFNPLRTREIAAVR
jgi:hypothetical protein